MKRIFFYATCLFLFLSNALASNQYQVSKIIELSINASINPATLNYLSESFEKAKTEEKPLIIIKLNTPGGLVTTTKEIITLIGKSNFPVAIWITPEGASATSAGAIISSAAHFLFMSEGANIGAATPITMGKDIEKDARSKAINDLVALVRSLSKARGRDAKGFEDMISKASSLDSREALEKKVIDSIINNDKELIQYLNGKSFQLKGMANTLSIDPFVSKTKVEMDPGQLLLNIFANPTTAYILFIIGAALIYFEMQAPGGIIAGSLGAFFLVLAAIGFQVLPLNFGAVGLIILSFILFILEAFITSFGVLTIGGLISLIIGSLFLFRTDNSLIELEISVIISVVSSIALYVGFISWYFIKTWHKKKDRFAQTKEHGIVSSIINMAENKYQIKVAGERWNAFSQEQLKVNDEVEVISQDNEHMILEVKKINK